MAVKLGRKFTGCELKESYHDAAVKNLRIAEQLSKSKTLFDFADEEA